jgi:hypothetical protein
MFNSKAINGSLSNFFRLYPGFTAISPVPRMGKKPILDITDIVQDYERERN